MTVQDFADKHYNGAPEEVLQHAGIACIRSYRSLYDQTPDKIQQGDFLVYDYPKYFEGRIMRVFKRIIKSGHFTPEIKLVIKKERTKKPKPIYSSNG